MKISKTGIRILRLSSRESPDLLSSRLPALKQCFPNLSFEDVDADTAWPFTSGSAAARAKQLNTALFDDDIGVIWCARGGYGASDLLTALNFDQLRSTCPTLIVGFSDVSALHSAMYARLGWYGLHAPMPATALWSSQTSADTVQLAQILRGKRDGNVPLQQRTGQSVSGRLFGGCFSVLTNLIGTPFFPASLAGHIVFLEDTGENPGRLLRFLNQWIQSGALDGVKAIVLGNFRDCGTPEQYRSYIEEQFAARTGLPVIARAQFGHCSPNFPLMIGAQATIADNQLSWTVDKGAQLWT